MIYDTDAGPRGSDWKHICMSDRGNSDVCTAVNDVPDPVLAFYCKPMC